jgi:hypothetical protein
MDQLSVWVDNAVILNIVTRVSISDHIVRCKYMICALNRTHYWGKDGRNERTRRRSKLLLDDPKEYRLYRKLKEEALERLRCRRGYVIIIIIIIIIITTVMMAAETTTLLFRGVMIFYAFQGYWLSYTGLLNCCAVTWWSYVWREFLWCQILFWIW